MQRLVGSNVNTPEYLLLQSAAWHIAGDETKARKLADGWFAAQKDETAHRNGKEFLEVVGRGEYASDTALDFSAQRRMPKQLLKDCTGYRLF